MKNHIYLFGNFLIRITIVLCKIARMAGGKISKRSFQIRTVPRIMLCEHGNGMLNLLF